MNFRILSTFRVVFATFIFSFNALIAASQDIQTEAAPTVKIGPEGVKISSSNEDFSLEIGGYLQTDSRFFLDDDLDLTDTFLLRRARINLEATFYDHVTVRFLPEFAGGSTVIQDAYIEWHQFDSANVRVGKFKYPLALERLKSATNLLLVERALTANLSPNRDIGIQVSGDLANGLFMYQAGVLNGSHDNGSTEVDTGDGKDITGRLFFNPSAKPTFLGGLGFGIAANSGKAPDRLPAYRSPGQAGIFEYNEDVIADGNARRISPQAHFYHGPFSIIAEYIISAIELRQSGIAEEIENHAWQIAGAYMLTGEKATPRSVSPSHPFDPSKGQWGAWQIAARYSELSIDEDAFALGFADPLSSAQKARAWAIGVNWYWNRNVKIVFNFERTNFEGGSAQGDREDENAFLTRFQIAF